MKNLLKINKGQSLLEFAIILPVFMLIIMGIFDLGRVVYYYSAIHNAAREGARYGSVNICDTTGITTAAKKFTVGLDKDVVVNTPIIIKTDNVPEYIIVEVTYDFETVTPLVGSFLGSDNSITLQSKAMNYVEVKEACP